MLPMLQAVSAYCDLPFIYLCKLTRWDRAVVTQELGRRVGYQSPCQPTGETGAGSICNPNQRKAHSHPASPWHAARNDSPVCIYRAGVRGLCSQLPLAIVRVIQGVLQPAPGTVLLPQACLAWRATLFLQEQVKTSRLINQSFLQLENISLHVSTALQYREGRSMTAFDPRHSQQADLTNLTV